MMSRNSMTRQEFLCTSMAAGATALMAAGVNTGANAQEMERTVRMGVVGVGNRGTGFVSTLVAMPGVEVPAICDINADRAAQSQQIVEEKTGKRPEAYTQGERDFERLCAREDLDAVITATPWQWHTPVALAAMRAKKYVGVEVPAAITVDECWDLVKTSEETGMPCMMLENVCYFQNVLTLTRMVREGVLGEILHCQGGYQHDCRRLMFNPDGSLTWRGKHGKEKNGNLYPTHPLGPISWWMNVNRGDRLASLTSLSTPSLGLNEYAAKTFGPEHEAAKATYALGDVNTTLIKTANGKTITLYFDLCTPRPYDLIFRLQGTKGLYMGSMDKIYVEGMSPKADEYEPFEPYLEKYPHPLWTDLEEKAKAHGGHGGCDYITTYEFIKAVRNKTQPAQDVYDAAAWSVIFPLSIESVAKGGAMLEVPDFTKGAWKTNAPVPVIGA